jgi:hypothetical protein
VLMVVSMRMASAPQLTMPLVRGAITFDLLLDVAFVAWGFASGIGLLRLREWARISMIVFGILMAFFCLLPMIIIPFVPIPSPEGGPANLGLMIHVGIEVFYGFFVALGIFWIVFFSRRSVREQFKPVAAADGAGPLPESAAGTPSILPAPAASKKPVLIVILGILYIVGACSLPFAFILHSPIFFFGHLFNGLSGDVVLITIATLCLATGVGLLRLQPWSWGMAVFLQALSVINSISLLAIPGAMERFIRTLLERELEIGVPSALPSAPLLGMKIGFIVGFAFSVAILWVLFAYKNAFQEPRTESTGD